VLLVPDGSLGDLTAGPTAGGVGGGESAGRRAGRLAGRGAGGGESSQRAGRDSLLASTVCSVLRAAEHDLAPVPGVPPPVPPPVPGAGCYTLLVGTGYLARYRVQRAQALLLATHLTLDQVAEATGHANRSHLTRAFRRLMGTTPTQLRRVR
jgi:AraC-like DNA-binding protein